jgi:tRNA pseudouridine55 synthase
MNAPTFHGLVVLDKPGGMTSRDAVDAALRWFPRGTRVGHTGTLDPLATGVLVLCVGSATRLTEYVQQMAKTYRTTVRLGARSDTDDADGTVTPVDVLHPPQREELENCLQTFLGEIEQVPPAFSAAKVTGRRAYDLARQGREVALEARRVRIDGIDVLRYEYPEADLEVRCGKGTYIRSLARDVGERLGCGGLVQVLRRTRVGPFQAADAVSLEADAATARVIIARINFSSVFLGM